LTVSAFVELDMATTKPKMIMDDLIIMDDLEANSGVTSGPPFGDGRLDGHAFLNARTIQIRTQAPTKPAISASEMRLEMVMVRRSIEAANAISAGNSISLIASATMDRSLLSESASRGARARQI